ncbi:hypothetical protein N0V88_003053 [Collariella sp. IMI 366227]|nr:hypothetical protein N0V88_003053 [Collariella sp. IMI 366227]
MAGISYAPSSVADLGVSGLALSSAAPSTLGRSVVAQQSGAGGTATATTTTATGSGYSFATPSEAFTADEDGGIYADARFAQPAAHQAQGQAIERYVDETDGASSSAQAGGGVIDEMNLPYSDEEMDFNSDGSSTLDGFEEVDGDEAT